MKAISVFIVLLSFSLTSNAASLTNLYQQQEDSDTLVISPVEYKGLPIAADYTSASAICGSLGYKRLVSFILNEVPIKTYEYYDVSSEGEVYKIVYIKGSLSEILTYKEIKCTR